MEKYLVTITRSGGLTDEHCSILKDYFDKRFQKVVMNVETHKSGLFHLHAYCESALKRPTIRNHLVRFMTANGLDAGAKALNVKQADSGARQYVVKDVTGDQPVALLKGWSIGQLLEERREALKKLSRKEIMGNWKVLSQDEAVPMMLRFAKNSSLAVTDKHSFIQLGIAMQKAKYSFAKVKRAVLYAEVMVQLGVNGPSEDDWENQLIGMR